MTEKPDSTKQGGAQLPPADVSPGARPGALDAIAQAAASGSASRAGGGQRAPAPVHLWNPPYCGDIGLEIRTDGSWWYQGSIIGRPAMVALFASVLRKDADGQTYLVTPVEKLLVRVADAPFLGVDLTFAGTGESQTLTMTTNLGDRVAVGPDHPLRFDIEHGTGGLKPYVLVRGRLEARLTRAMTHELVRIALSGPGADAGGLIDTGQPNQPYRNEHRLGVWSGGVFWTLPGP